MKILAISDRAPDNLRETLANDYFDLIITLGDLSYFDIKELEFTNIPKIGVYGNHCTRGYMELLGIKNMHLTTFEFGGMTFGGFEWCVRYKPGNHVMYTQYEATEMLKNFPKVDVFLSHCPPRGINDNDDEPHHGFDAIRSYLDVHSPKILMHGHTYDYWNFVSKYKNTQIFYIEKERIIEILV